MPKSDQHAPSQEERGEEIDEEGGAGEGGGPGGELSSNPISMQKRTDI